MTRVIYSSRVGAMSMAIIHCGIDVFQFVTGDIACCSSRLSDKVFYFHHHDFLTRSMGEARSLIAAMVPDIKRKCAMLRQFFFFNLDGVGKGRRANASRP